MSSLDLQQLLIGDFRLVADLVDPPSSIRFDSGSGRVKTRLDPMVLQIDRAEDICRPLLPRSEAARRVECAGFAPVHGKRCLLLYCKPDVLLMEKSRCRSLDPIELLVQASLFRGVVAGPNIAKIVLTGDVEARGGVVFVGESNIHLLAHTQPKNAEPLPPSLHSIQTPRPKTEIRPLQSSKPTPPAKRRRRQTQTTLLEFFPRDESEAEALDVSLSDSDRPSAPRVLEATLEGAKFHVRLADGSSRSVSSREICADRDFYPLCALLESPQLSRQMSSSVPYVLKLLNDHLATTCVRLPGNESPLPDIEDFEETCENVEPEAEIVRRAHVEDFEFEF
ncbi:MAG: uncharacterized protein KVP18_002131 [Porospora cf. gigantea A]|nr:MAG: hypothetical protein KVP18_002131 [Porospora cf. gigantea A]